MSIAMSARFFDLHAEGACLLLANCWDAASAVAFAQAGATALGTSSAAMAWACGHADGGALPSASLLQRTREILRVIQVPLTVDIEDGYSDDPDVVASLVVKLVASGVAGINLEDGAGSPDALEAKLQAIRRALQGRALFVNARTDVYLRDLAQGEEAVAMTIDRLRRYRESGADGAFVPGLRRLAEIASVADAVPMPLNVMAVPGLPELSALRRAGVRRLSAGPALFLQTFGAGQKMARHFLDGAMFDGEGGVPGYADYNRWLA